MKIKIDYIESEIDFDISDIYTLEVYNKKYLYRISSLMYSLSCGDFIDEIKCFDDEFNELKLTNKVNFFSNYFDFEFNSKKYSNDIVKYILSNIEQFESETILKLYTKMCGLINKELTRLELPISISYGEGIADVIKMLKFSVLQKDELLDNLFLIIDLESILNSNKILCFTNLKQYLTREELIEFYKYASYNSRKVIMIESTKCEQIREYEKIIIIDQDLDEYVI